jgi:hypothetical protein
VIRFSAFYRPFHWSFFFLTKYPAILYKLFSFYTTISFHFSLQVERYNIIYIFPDQNCYFYDRKISLSYQHKLFIFFLLQDHRKRLFFLFLLYNPVLQIYLFFATEGSACQRKMFYLLSELFLNEFCFLTTSVVDPDPMVL